MSDALRERIRHHVWNCRDGAIDVDDALDLIMRDVQPRRTTMTTTVTVKTHGWPVRVDTSSSHSFDDGNRRSYGHSHTSEFVPKESERSFSVSDTTSVTVSELPADATGLDTGSEAGANQASATLG